MLVSPNQQWLRIRTNSHLSYTDAESASTLSESTQIQLTCFDPACTGFSPTMATLTLSSEASGQAEQVGPFDSQPLGPGLLTVTLDTPENGKTNFLTLAFTGASIFGFDGDTSAQINSSGSSTFTSDFLNYSDVSFQLNTDVDPGLSVDDSGYLNSFTGDATFGSFTGNAVATAVPEPLTLSLFGAGLAGAAALRRRRKKTKA